MKFYSLGQISNNEKSDILSKHREMYNGYKTVHQPVSNTQPLFTQDFANDKNGITVSNKGEVGNYTNKLYMKESKEDAVCECGGMMYEGECSECGMKYEGEWKESEGELDEISVEKLEKGKKYKYKSPSFEDEIEYEETHHYPQGEPMHGFKGKNAWHSMGDLRFVHDMDDDVDEGIYDVEDIKPKNKFDYVEDKDYETMESAFSEMDEIAGPSPLYSKVDPAYDFESDGPLQAKGPYYRNEMEEGMSDYFQDDYDAIHDYFGKDDEEDEDERDNAFKRMKRGVGDVEDIEWEEIDGDIKESFKNQKYKINEMMYRMSKYC